MVTAWLCAGPATVGAAVVGAAVVGAAVVGASVVGAAVVGAAVVGAAVVVVESGSSVVVVAISRGAGRHVGDR